MNRVAIAVVSLALAGCAQGTFTTRASITLAGDKVMLNSQYGKVPSIGTEMDERDAWAIIEAFKAKAALDMLLGLQKAPTKPAKMGQSI